MTYPLIVADENIDYRLTKLLRENNFEVFTIFENERGIKDSNVLTIAHDKNAFLITEDKDFGDLAIRDHLPHKGILLIRRKRLSALEMAQIVLKILSSRFDELENHFSVLRDEKLIIRD